MPIWSEINCTTWYSYLMIFMFTVSYSLLEQKYLFFYSTSFRLTSIVELFFIRVICFVLWLVQDLSSTFIWLIVFMVKFNKLTQLFAKVNHFAWCILKHWQGDLRLQLIIDLAVQFFIKEFVFEHLILIELLSCLFIIGGWCI